MPAPFVYQAPASCPSESDFGQRVVGWLDAGDPTMLAAGRLHLDAHPGERGDRAFAGQATLPKSGTARDLHAASCDELVTAFAFVFAVDLDERVLERARPEPPSPSPSRAPTSSPTPRDAPPPLPPPTPLGPRRLSFSLAALTGVGGGVLPHATPLEGLEVEARSARDGEAGLFLSPRLRLGVAFDIPASASSAGVSGGTAGGTFLALRVRLDACPLALGQSIVDVSLCARAETSLLFASGSGVAGARSATDVLSGIGGSARVSLRLSPQWTLGVDGGLVPPFGPDRFTVQDGASRLYATSALTESAQVLLAFRFH